MKNRTWRAPEIKISDIYGDQAEQVIAFAERHGSGNWEFRPFGPGESVVVAGPKAGWDLSLHGSVIPAIVLLPPAKRRRIIFEEDPNGIFTRREEEF